jgi:hypothetical protein
MYVCMYVCVCMSSFENSNEPAIREMELRDPNVKARKLQFVEY